MCGFRGRLPQGTVTSPTLSNFVFRRCDEDLSRLASQHGLNYSRYSDDLFFSGRDSIHVDEIIREISKVLLSYGFRINTDKTKIRRRNHRQEVLGLTVNDRIHVTREYRRKLLQELYYLERFGKNCKGAVESGDYLRYMQQLQGKLAYVLHIDPENSNLWEAHLKPDIRINKYSFLRERLCISPSVFYFRGVLKEIIMVKELMHISFALSGKLLHCLKWIWAVQRGTGFLHPMDRQTAAS